MRVCDSLAREILGQEGLIAVGGMSLFTDDQNAKDNATIPQLRKTIETMTILTKAFRELDCVSVGDPTVPRPNGSAPLISTYKANEFIKDYQSHPKLGLTTHRGEVK
jgi:hypothetical protein